MHWKIKIERDCTKLVEFANSVTTHDRTIIILRTNALKNKVVSALKSKDNEGGGSYYEIAHHLGFLYIVLEIISMRERMREIIQFELEERLRK